MPAVVARPADLPTSGVTRDEGEDLSLKRLLEVSTIVLQQAIDLVDNDLTSDEQLSIHSQYMPGSTIGNVALTNVPAEDELIGLQASTFATRETTLPSSWTQWRRNPHSS